MKLKEVHTDPSVNDPDLIVNNALKVVLAACMAVRRFVVLTPRLCRSRSRASTSSFIPRPIKCSS